MARSFWSTFAQRATYFIHQGFSVKIFFLAVITVCYCLRAQPFDWVYVVLVGMLLAFREGKEFLLIWQGRECRSNTSGSLDK